MEKMMIDEVDSNFKGSSVSVDNTSRVCRDPPRLYGVCFVVTTTGMCRFGLSSNKPKSGERGNISLSVCLLWDPPFRKTS